MFDGTKPSAILKREYHKWYCHDLSRDMEMLVFGHAGARVLVFPTRVGRFYDYENMGMVDSLRHHIQMGWIQLFCVDSIDHETFYCDWCRPRDRILRHLAYERYLLNEVLPLTRHYNDTPFLISHGCSLGAYHAVNIAFRHPHLFDRVVALSGRYDLCQELPGYRNLLDGHYDDDVYFNMPNHYVPNMSGAALDGIRTLDIKLVVGELDPFRHDNECLSQALWDNGVWHMFRVWSGKAHSFRRWRDMVGWFL